MPEETSHQLPDYERPPVVEIVAAVQFQPLRGFGMPEVVRVAGALSGEWRIADVPPALGRIVEEPSASIQSESMMTFGLGPPPRAILTSADDRWLAQLQGDRLAVHERKRGERPSFTNVMPKLESLRNDVAKALDANLFEEPHLADLVELTYTNRIPVPTAEVANVLRFVSADGVASLGPIDGYNQGFSTSLGSDAQHFEGRLRVLAHTERDPDGGDVLQLQLISRRYVGDAPLPDVLERCHRDIVESFTDITDERMHREWGRFR